jgi:hypothetical protein
MGDLSCRWEGNTIMVLKGTACEDVNWTELSQKTIQCLVFAIITVTNIQVP